MCNARANSFGVPNSPAAEAEVANKDGVVEKIEKKYTNIKKDKWVGFDRVIFNFRGCETWIVEPEKPAAGNPWAWIMEWPEAFALRVGVPALLKAGYRIVTFRPGFYEGENFVSRPGNMNDKRIKESREFQRMLVDELDFAAKGRLIGMSWGGFYSVRYASAHPECISHIYLDAPLLDFSTLPAASKDKSSMKEFYGIDIENYDGKDDPRQSVNRAEPIAKAGIPILLLYGGCDIIVPPEKNCVPFIERFKKFGGKIKVINRAAYGHHPHGLDPIDAEQQTFVDFFNS